MKNLIFSSTIYNFVDATTNDVYSITFGTSSDVVVIIFKNGEYLNHCHTKLEPSKEAALTILNEYLNETSNS